MRARAGLTAMGVLEACMWAGGAGVLVTFWLWWPGLSDKPEPAQPAAKRGAVHVLFSPALDAEPDTPSFREWRESFRKATEPAGLTAGAGAGVRNDWPHATGSGPARAVTFPVVSGHAAEPAASETAAHDAPVRHIDEPAPLVMDTAEQDGEVMPEAPLSLAEAAQDISIAAVEPASLDLTGMERDEVASAAPTQAAPEPSDERHEIADAPTEMSLAVDQSSAHEQAAALLQTEPATGLQPPDTPIPATLAQDDVTDEFASLRAPAQGPEPVVPIAEPAPLVMSVVAAETPAPTVPEATREQAAAAPSHPDSALKPADRDILVQKGEEMMARGDVIGARMFFARAAEAGDPRAALGMARTFDQEVLRRLRVVGVRADADQAARWYARSKGLNAVASTR